MRPDYVDWDEPDDPQGNVWHVAAADLSPAEVEEVLDEPDGQAVPSEGAAEGMEALDRLRLDVHWQAHRRGLRDPLR